MVALSKVLIANRSEIAVRVVRAVRDLGKKSVAIYNSLDANSQYVELADEAYSLGEGTFRDTYMNQEMVLEIAKKSGADAIHPGYGLLSENSEFAKKVVDAGLKWIGPSASAIERLGDKVKARKVAEAAKVSPVPGLSDFISSPDVVKKFIQNHGYPVILKRADGGGGQGISVIKEDQELERFLTAHTHDINAYFIERFVEKARHVETQCARDSYGNFAVVSTRDCTIQRRNQKLLEEAPAPFVNDEIKVQLFEWSKSLFETVGYEGLGTCEFLLETDPKTLSQQIYFLEVNPRIQVEHTVSEEVSGVDLVEEQILIAQGLELSEPLKAFGGNLIKANFPKHSFELRITSESPEQNMTPTGGEISKLSWPTGPGIRLEPGIVLGDKVSTDFDSMVAKIIITGNSRKQVIARTLRALKEFEIEGISTPKHLFNYILEQDEFITENFNEFQVYTKWLETDVLPHFIKDDSGDNSSETQSPEQTEQKKPNLKEFVIEIDGKRTVIKLPSDMLTSNISNQSYSSGYGVVNSSQSPQSAPRISSLLRRKNNNQNSAIDVKDGQIPSPIQAFVVQVVVNEGDQVQEGDLLVVLEAMKMEKFINAPASGKIKQINVKAGDSVVPGTILVEMDS